MLLDGFREKDPKLHCSIRDSSINIERLHLRYAIRPHFNLTRNISLHTCISIQRFIKQQYKRRLKCLISDFNCNSVLENFIMLLYNFYFLSFLITQGKRKRSELLPQTHQITLQSINLFLMVLLINMY